MDYETWCKSSQEVLAMAEQYNDWRIKAKFKLLNEYGPRLAKLSETLYMGCGFHYYLEQQFGKLIASLALPWQPSANHCEKIEQEQANNLINKVIYEDFVRSIVKGEKPQNWLEKQLKIASDDVKTWPEWKLQEAGLKNG